MRKAGVLSSLTDPLERKRGIGRGYRIAEVNLRSGRILKSWSAVVADRVAFGHPARELRDVLGSKRMMRS